MTDLNTLKIKELVGIHNGLNPDAPLNSWKSKKSELVARIEVLRDAVTADTKPEATETTSVAETETKATGNKSPRTIRAAAMEHLCHVAFYEDRARKSDPTNVVPAESKGARSVGLPYDEIIRRIVGEFPDCRTSVACLRWYSVKIRVEEEGYEGLKLPQRRPRVRPLTAS